MDRDTMSTPAASQGCLLATIGGAVMPGPEHLGRGGEARMEVVVLTILVVVKAKLRTDQSTSMVTPREKMTVSRRVMVCPGGVEHGVGPLLPRHRSTASWKTSQACSPGMPRSLSRRRIVAARRLGVAHPEQDCCDGIAAGVRRPVQIMPLSLTRKEIVGGATPLAKKTKAKYPKMPTSCTPWRAAANSISAHIPHLQAAGQVYLYWPATTSSAARPD